MDTGQHMADQMDGQIERGILLYNEIEKEASEKSLLFFPIQMEQTYSAMGFGKKDVNKEARVGYVAGYIEASKQRFGIITINADHLK